MNDFRAGGIREPDRSGNQRNSCTSANRSLRNCMSLAPEDRFPRNRTGSIGS